MGFDGAQGLLEAVGDLGMGEAFEIGALEGAALFGIELFERGGDEGVGFGVLQGIGELGRGNVDSGGRVEGHPGGRRPPAQPIKGAGAGHAEDVGEGLRAVVVIACAGSPELKENIDSELFGLVGIAEHAETEGVDEGPVAVVELPERGLIAGRQSEHEREVIGCGVSGCEGVSQPRISKVRG